MSNPGPPPVIPDSLQQYDSYAVDPKYQIKFTVVWTSVFAFAIVATLPIALRQHQLWLGCAGGVREDWNQGKRLDEAKIKNKYSWYSRLVVLLPFHAKSTRAFSAFRAACYSIPPFAGGLNVGQMILILAYFTTVLLCTTLSVPLSTNSNRAGFLALAQLPPLFLFSAKSSPFSLLFLPPHFSYTKLNFLHRWAARGIVLCVLIHGSIWLKFLLRWGLPILGQQKEGTGLAGLGLLCVLSIASLPVVRERFWRIFNWVHFLATPAFFIVICYHTPYASPWIFAPIAIYTFDLYVRSFRMRVKEGYLICVDQNMTIIHIPHCTSGFHAGQHLRTRVFFEGHGLWEAHPLSVMCAPASQTCIKAQDMRGYYPGLAQSNARPDDNGMVAAEESHTEETGPLWGYLEGEDRTPPGIVLGARVAGNWTRALSQYASEQEARVRRAEAVAAAGPIPIPVRVMFDGPYGGCTLDLRQYERVMLFAGGSGATFAVGVLDELVGLTLRDLRSGEVKTRTVVFVWCTRGFGSIRWLAPLLRPIACAAAASAGYIQVKIHVYVTCPCAPEETLLDVPGMKVHLDGERPDLFDLLCGAGDVDEVVRYKEKESDQQMEGVKAADVEMAARTGGRVAVCVSGPVGMVRDAANAVARFRIAKGRRVEVDLHTEAFRV